MRLLTMRSCHRVGNDLTKTGMLNSIDEHTGLRVWTGLSGQRLHVTHMPSRVLILMSTYNGAAYLRAQLSSLVQQTHSDWILYWRDDGSTDDTVAVMSAFASEIGVDRCLRILSPTGRIGPTASFFTILRSAAREMREDDIIAFADQDDVWLPEKLARGVEALTEAEAKVPTLYCARLIIADAILLPLRETRFSPEVCNFPSCLAQNIATGCTILLNGAAARLIAASNCPKRSWHDWWCYLIVTAVGGQIILDNAVVALYRQHSANFVGMNVSQARRALAALRRGPSAFMGILRQHVAALLGQPALVSESNHDALQRLQHALQGGILRRLAALYLPGFRRQDFWETLLFRIWFLLG